MPYYPINLAGFLLVVCTLILMEMALAHKRVDVGQNNWCHMVQDATVSDGMYTPELTYASSLTFVGCSKEFNWICDALQTQYGIESLERELRVPIILANSFFAELRHVEVN